MGIAGDLFGGFLLSQDPAVPDDRGSMPKRSPLRLAAVCLIALVFEALLVHPDGIVLVSDVEASSEE